VSWNQWLLNLKRSQNPLVAGLRSFVYWLRTPVVPRWPSVFQSPLRVVYELWFLVVGLWQVMTAKFLTGAMFQGRCASFGKGVTMAGLPYVNGHTEIHIGNESSLGGNCAIHSGRVHDQPRLEIRDRASIGWNAVLVVNREVIIEEDVMISSDCRISDSDGHPREIDLRIAKQPPKAEDVRPVRICRGAWIGNGVHILKGVTIGEGAVVAANSVVMHEVPPYCLAVGNPAEVLLRNYGLPSTHVKKKRQPGPPPTGE
jgi:acetyltransferase-like isoleucine patch superfamily enzyme